MNREAVKVRHVDIITSQTCHDIQSIFPLQMEALCAPPTQPQSQLSMESDTVMKIAKQELTYVVIRALVNDWDVNHLDAEILLNLLNEKVYISNSVEGTVCCFGAG